MGQHTGAGKHTVTSPTLPAVSQQLSSFFFFSMFRFGGILSGRLGSAFGKSVRPWAPWCRWKWGRSKLRASVKCRKRFVLNPCICRGCMCRRLTTRLSQIDICDFATGLSRSLNGSVMPSERPNHFMMVSEQLFLQGFRPTSYKPLQCHHQERYNPLKGHVGIVTAFNFPVMFGEPKTKTTEEEKCLFVVHHVVRFVETYPDVASCVFACLQCAVFFWNTALSLVCGNTNIWKPATSVSLVAVACTKIVADVLAEVGTGRGRETTSRKRRKSFRR